MNNVRITEERIKAIEPHIRSGNPSALHEYALYLRQSGNESDALEIFVTSSIKGNTESSLLAAGMYTLIPYFFDENKAKYHLDLVFKRGTDHQVDIANKLLSKIESGKYKKVKEKYDEESKEDPRESYIKLQTSLIMLTKLSQMLDNLNASNEAKKIRVLGADIAIQLSNKQG